MADLDTVLIALTEKIILEMSGIKPNHHANDRFHSPKDLATEKIEGQTGADPRIFEVLWGEPVGLDGGHTQKAWQIDATIKIGYPNQSEWNIAKASDVQQIFSRFNVNDHGIAEVHYRQVPQGEQPETEEAENDWLWMSVPLRAAMTTE